MNSEQNLTVAVITPTLGRESLIKAIESVQQQTYPCKHYIFVDGEKYHKAVKKMVKPYPNVTVIYLPMNTGGTAKKLLNSAINSAATFLVEEDIICYLDDDNWYDPHHVEILVKDMQYYQADYAYNLRYFVDKKGDVICADNSESLGFWKIADGSYDFNYVVSGKLIKNILSFNNLQSYLIDTNCIAFRRELAQQLSLIWIKDGYLNDRNATQFLLEQQFTGICTAHYTVYYYYDAHKSCIVSDEIIEVYQLYDEQQFEKFALANILAKQQSVNHRCRDEQGKFAWQYKTMIKNGELLRVE